MRAQPISLLVPLLIVVSLSLVFIWMHQSCSRVTLSYVANDCEQSLRESDGFICEPKSDWNERKVAYHNQDEQNLVKLFDVYYFLRNWEPNFHCAHSRRVGARGDGGKWVCDPHRLKLSQSCLIYSIGSSGEFSFESDIKSIAPHCEIHAFDQSGYSCPTNTCTFHQVRVGDGIEPNNSKTWSHIIEQLNHTNRVIDILKIDVEGAEFTFFPVIFNSSRSTFPRQILAEVHPINLTIIHQFFHRLRDHSYVIFSKENNLVAGPYFFEFAFLRLNPLFFVESPLLAQ